MSETMSGGCQCGRVRYTANVEPREAYLCHCKMCRRATGSVSIAFINVSKREVVWHTEPDWYQSSPIGRRPFCSHCGTPLGFDFVEAGTHIDITVGSFDDPTPFRPCQNYATESMLEGWADIGHLPGIRSDENANVVERWRAAGLEQPE